MNFLEIFILINSIVNLNSQFISTGSIITNVNRPLQRWEQFQKQLKLNQFGNSNIALNRNNQEQTNDFLLNQNKYFKNNLNSNDILNQGLKQQLNENSYFLNENNRFLLNNNKLNFMNKSEFTDEVSTLNQNRNKNQNNSINSFLPVDLNKENNVNNLFFLHKQNTSSSNLVQLKNEHTIQQYLNLNSNLTKNHYIELSKKFMNLTLSITDSQFRGFLKFVHELSGKINSDCMSTLISLFYGIRRQQSWALKFLDSSGFFPRGIIDGTFTSLGEYDQCISIKIPSELVKRNKEINPNVYGKYCLSKLHLTKFNLLSNQDKIKFLKTYDKRLKQNSSNNNDTNSNEFFINIQEENVNLIDEEDHLALNNFNKLKFNGTIIQNTVFENISQLGINLIPYIEAFRVGICAPSTCTSKDITIFLNKLLNEYKVYAQVSSKCDTNVEFQSSYKSKYTLISISIFLISLLMVCMGTISDFIRCKQARCGVYPSEQLYGKLLRCWSLKTAIYSLTKCNCEIQNELYPIHGIKVLFSLWLIWSSTYLFGIFYSILWLYKRLIVVKEMPTEFWFQMIANSFLIADSFFFISGLLLVYVGIPILSRAHGKMQFLSYLVQRIIRVMLSLIGLFCLYVLLLHFVSGPVFLDNNVHKQLISNCEQNWWKSIFFINNVDVRKNLCLPHTWFLSANMQLSIIFMPIVMIMYQKTKIAIHLIILLILLGIVYSSFITYDANLDPVILANQITNINYINHHLQLTYFPTLQHFVPYGIGLLTGCLILNRPSLLKNCNKNLISFLWMLLPFFSLIIIFLPYIWNNGYDLSTIESVLYAGTHRLVYIIGMSFVTYSLTNGKSNFVNRILCSNFFVPLSRLNLAIYLVHLPIIFLKFYTSKNTIVYSNLDFLFNTFTICFLSLIFGFLLFVLFQSPIESTGKIIFNINKGNSNMLSYNPNFHKNNLDTQISNFDTKICHCGKSAARLAAKVNIDFSTFGIKSITSGDLLNNPQAINSTNFNTNLTSSNRSLTETYSSESNNFLVHNVISYDTNGNPDIKNVLDKVDELDSYLNNNDVKPMQQNQFNKYSANNSASCRIKKNFLPKLIVGNQQQSVFYDTTYTNYQNNHEINSNKDFNINNVNKINQISPDFNNQLRNNAANEIRKRLEKIKLSASKTNQIENKNNKIQVIEDDTSIETISKLNQKRSTIPFNLKETKDEPTTFNFYPASTEMTNNFNSFAHSNISYTNQFQNDQHLLAIQKEDTYNNYTFKV